MVLGYFGKGAKHCGGRRKACSIKDACARLDTAKRNPWTGRRLRKTIRAELKELCVKEEHHPVGKVVTLSYWDKHEDQYHITLSKSLFRKFGVTRKQLGKPGTYWTVYRASKGQKYAIKIQPLKTIGDQTRMHTREEAVYKMASNHNIGPEVFDWFYIKEGDFTAIKALTGRKVTFHSIAVAVVGLYDRAVDARVKKMPSYDRHMETLIESLEQFEEMHMIANNEWQKDANLLVNLTADGGDVQNLIVGDWGKLRIRHGVVLECKHKEK
jgi:hypothetical protein